MRQQIKDALDRVGLLSAAFALRQGARSARVETVRGNLRTRRPAPGEPPWPPLRLVYAVNGHFQRGVFAQVGRDHFDDICAAIRTANGDVPGPETRVLDYGCGCGRVLRHWKTLDGVDVYGTDVNPKLVSWCQEHLTFASVGQNGPLPPLDYPDDQFDVVYTISVFTHLHLAAQHAWVDELTRVLRPNGLLIVTVHGSGATGAFDQNMLDRLETEGVLVLHETRSGSQVCATYHTEAYMKQQFAPALELVAFEPRGLRWSTMDVAVFRKPS